MIRLSDLALPLGHSPQDLEDAIAARLGIAPADLLRCTLWRQWKRPYTRARNLMKAGLKEERAFRSAFNQRGPWWNSGARHMNAAFPKVFFDRLGLVSLLDTTRRLQGLS